jgi:hypothetical protein
LGGVCVQIENVNGRSAGGETSGDGAADAAASASDDGKFVVEAKWLCV